MFEYRQGCSMAMQRIGHRLWGIPARQDPRSPGRASTFTVGRTLCPLVRAIHSSENDSRTAIKRDSDVALFPVTPTWQRTLAGIAAGICAWSITLPVLAGTDGPDTSILGPTADTLLGAGPEFSFTTLLLFTLLCYWLVKAVMYISTNTPDGHDKDGKQQPPGGSDMTDIGHAHIRSYVDSSQPGPAGELGARDLRNASLARSAAYRVTATLKESQPRIHALVEELAAPQTQWPPQPPRNLDVDFVAAMVYNRMVRERSAKGPEYVLAPRELAALETRLLEEVAEKVAADQVAEFVSMAAKGTLHPGRSGGGGADKHPHSHAH
ncbi:hypothetical protein Vretimale_4761 [Volvox reticuliferus]|uniref:Uncharacterized protein n=1 Tax=Volvox reticuliferus TaxID=1737510 RepID=A0A8J4C7G6_9CHLO|nr:hypothetical protein Vretifemale_3362 [Volvox reticuliferus]GIL99638.1 hypothetical protein Vretimale_4761 [Volvox reticuliferus]